MALGWQTMTNAELGITAIATVLQLSIAWMNRM